MPAETASSKDASRSSSYTFSETYSLYNEQVHVHCPDLHIHLIAGSRANAVARTCGALPQLHYARATYTREQLDRWQADWNAYFVRYGMEIPPYAHKVSGAPAPAPRSTAEVNSAISSLLAA